MPQVLGPSDALAFAGRWAAVAELGGGPLPLLVVDLRALDRSFRAADQDAELAARITVSPWVNVAIVDDDLDPIFAPLADAFDVLIGAGTDSDAAFDTDDVEGTLRELATAVEASPMASVALVRLLRTSHALPVEQALHAESLTYAVLQTNDVFRAWLADRPEPKPAVPGERAVATEVVGSTLRITLQRPDRRNALNIAMRDQLTEALEWLDLDGSLDGAVITGAGSNFSAGGDLDEFGSTPSPAVGHRVRMLRSLPALMHRVAGRTRVHVHGSCVGAGIELPAFSHSVIAHPDATFRLPEIGFGLVPGAGGTVSITRRCGRHRAAWLALTGRRIDAEHALRWGIVDRIDG